MYLQGNLQNVFDALYELGVIDPVLEQDWGKAWDSRPKFAGMYERAVQIANQFQHDVTELMNRLEGFDSEILSFLAMEVAREFADFHAREEIH